MSGLEDDLLELMPHWVFIAKLTGKDEYGVPTFASAINYQARVEKKTKMVRTAAGDEKISNATVYLAKLVGVTPADKITLPSGEAPPILSVDAQPDNTGSYYEAIYV